jgi:hypothetical protein
MSRRLHTVSKYEVPVGNVKGFCACEILPAEKVAPLLVDRFTMGSE